MKNKKRMRCIISLILLLSMLMPFTAFAGTINVEKDSKLTTVNRCGF